jgi:regulatory associated protein of mTOR
MRDPTLVEPRSSNALTANPPHGRQTRVALGLEAGGQDTNSGITNGDASLGRQNAQFRVVYAGDGSADRQDDSDTPTFRNGASQLVAPATSNFPPSSRSERPRPARRANSDYGPRHRSSRNVALVEDELWRMRHGWEDEYTSNEYLALLNSVSLSIHSTVSAPSAYPTDS